MELLPRFLVMAGLLGVSAFFSGSETAFFSLDPLALHRFRTRGGRLGRLVILLRARSNALLVSVLLGNMAVNLLYFSIAAVLAVGLKEQARDLEAGAVPVLSLVCLLVFGEVVPKTIALTAPETFARVAAAPLALFALVAAPGRAVLLLIVNAFDRFITFRIPTGPLIMEEDIRTLIRLSEEEGQIDRDEGRLLQESMDLFGLSVRHVMVPRVDVIAFPVDGDGAELRALAREKKVTKVPVYQGTRDRMVGVVKAKNLFLYPDKDIRSLVEPVIFVPETMAVEDLLREFRRKGRARAIVVDEYGGTEGLVTLEDVVEEVVGEIYDEYDSGANPIQKIGPDTYRLLGTMGVQDWGQILGPEVEQGRVATFSGFMALRLGRIPRTDDTVTVRNIRLTVETVERRRAAAIRLSFLPSHPEGPDQEGT